MGEEEKGVWADLERRVGLALAEEIASSNGASIDVLCEIEVDGSETRIVGRIWVPGDHALR